MLGENKAAPVTPIKGQELADTDAFARMAVDCSPIDKRSPTAGGGDQKRLKTDGSGGGSAGASAAPVDLDDDDLRATQELALDRTTDTLNKSQREPGARRLHTRTMFDSQNARALTAQTL